jgi:hypothetical protein
MAIGRETESFPAAAADAIGDCLEPGGRVEQVDPVLIGNRTGAAERIDEGLGLDVETGLSTLSRPSGQMGPSPSFGRLIGVAGQSPSKSRCSPPGILARRSVVVNSTLGLDAYHTRTAIRRVPP